MIREASFRIAAECQRYRQTSRIHAVETANPCYRGGKHIVIQPMTMQYRAFEEIRTEVVVSHKDGFIAGNQGNAASGDDGRRAIQGHRTLGDRITAHEVQTLS